MKNSRKIKLTAAYAFALFRTTPPNVDCEQARNFVIISTMKAYFIKKTLKDVCVPSIVEIFIDEIIENTEKDGREFFRIAKRFLEYFDVLIETMMQEGIIDEGFPFDDIFRGELPEHFFSCSEKERVFFETFKIAVE